MKLVSSLSFALVAVAMSIAAAVSGCSQKTQCMLPMSCSAVCTSNSPQPELAAACYLFPSNISPEALAQMKSDVKRFEIVAASATCVMEGASLTVHGDTLDEPTLKYQEHRSPEDLGMSCDDTP